MVEVYRLRPNGWGGTDPVVAYNNADGLVLYAHAVTGELRAYYYKYGYNGTKEIVCIDCKEYGLEVPVSFVDPKEARAYFRHPAGMAPVGKGRHGETAQHIHGKHLISEWARSQRAVDPGSVVEEQWVPGIRLRSDVRITLKGGAHVAFEIQRKQLGEEAWQRRHGGYVQGGVKDMWLWSPTVGSPKVGPPTASVVFDVENESLGVFVARYDPQGYRHPWSQRYRARPTHYAAAPLAEWSISEEGWLIAPKGLGEFIGTPPASVYAEELPPRQRKAGGLKPVTADSPGVDHLPRTGHAEALTEVAEVEEGNADAHAEEPQQLDKSSPSHRPSDVHSGNKWRTFNEEDQRIEDALRRIFGRKR